MNGADAHSMSKMSVILTGFMGTGKTTVGQRLAECLGKEFVDTDRHIEQLEGRSVAAIFAMEGEAYFRAIERRVIAQTMRMGAVVATGGGAIMDPTNFERMRAAGPIICLTAEVDVLLQRTSADDSRPLLADSERRKRVNELLHERAAAYSQADVAIDTSHRTVEGVLDEILAFLRTTQKAPQEESTGSRPLAERTGVQLDTVSVELGDRSYPIVIGTDVLGEIGPRLGALLTSRQAAIVTNPTVGKLYLSRVLTSLQAAGFRTTTIEIPDGEEHKNLAWLAFVYDRLLDARMDRTSPLLALGGGVIGDLTGFAAATFLRGVPFVQLPTTLLAQVDSSVGGKTGVNHPAGKNLIGTFYQPGLVLVDVDTLRTLPRREFVAGLVEVIKYGAVLDAELFARIEQNLDRILAFDADLLQGIVRRCCELKASVVQQDERESDYRSILNFGHTIGHAIESLTEYKQYLHGEAVAMGMAFAAQISRSRGYCKEETVQRIVELLKRAGLSVEVPKELAAANLGLAVESDKKVADGKVKFVCLTDLGQTRFTYMTGQEIAEFAAR
jgi:shikimate kinase / 3-dehydroquinate synthase